MSSELIKSSLKELSQDLNLIQNKKKDLAKKFDLDSKMKLMNEIILLKDRTKRAVEKLDREYEVVSEKVRSDFISAIRSNKSEYEKMVKEIDKIHNQIKKERLLDKTLDTEHESEGDKYNYLNSKLTKQNNNLTRAQQMGVEVASTQDKTLLELQRQKEKLKSANEMMGEVEQTLSLHDQIVGVMSNRELFSKLKLVAVVLMLFIADLLVLYIKLR